MRRLTAGTVCAGLLQPCGLRVAGDRAAGIGGRNNGGRNNCGCQAEYSKSRKDQILHRYLHPSSRARCPAYDGRKIVTSIMKVYEENWHKTNAQPDEIGCTLLGKRSLVAGTNPVRRLARKSKSHV